MSTRIWEETVTIPTYGWGEPDPHPMFLEKRVYQGSSGVVYPHPIIESISDEKRDRDYHAVFLENDWLKVMVLPCFGGRIQMMLDKTNDQHAIYYNRVIKPALVGLTGPWLSGGIEFNWPQHHRPSTFDPVEYTIEEHDDGSKTLWVGEIERMFRTKGMAGFRIHPDRAYLEIHGQVHNRTDLPQTMLWWANPAIAVDEHHQSIFPPDVTAVFDHGKRDVSRFPIATGEYYKVDYSAGVDISRYKNIPVPTSYMAYKSDYDFVGAYNHGTEAGLLHVADHHVAPGKKQWTWGCGDFGQAWDRQLTDEDGPYIELMTGVFTDNQPDFSWLMPAEERRFVQVFMPYKGLANVKNANTEAALDCDWADGEARCGVYVTSARQGLRLIAEDEAGGNEELAIGDLATAAVWHGSFACERERYHRCTLRVVDGDGHELVRFAPRPAGIEEIPPAAQPAADPRDQRSVEACWLTGLHLEQYRHATYEPSDYYLEGLRRDEDDIRCNTAMGQLLYRRGRFAEALPYLERAVARWKWKNPNPYDGEPLYLLGQALVALGRDAAAEAPLAKATWNAAWQEAAHFQLARLHARRGDLRQADGHAEAALQRNWRHHQARHLQTALRRRAGDAAAARQLIALGLEQDALNLNARVEAVLLGDAARDDFLTLIRADVQTLMELAWDYAHAGLFDDASTLLAWVTDADDAQPLAAYYLAYWVHRAGDAAAAKRWLRVAAQADPHLCFPHRLEDIGVLEWAMHEQPDDARAPYYLGCLWYSKRQYEPAIACWERARDLDPGFAITHRNLGLAYCNKRDDPEAAWASYERAVACAPNDARLLFELDQLALRRNEAPEQRLARLQAKPDLVERRDDLFLERIACLNRTDHPAEALDLLRARHFHPWEGGEGKPSGNWIAAHLALARKALDGRRWDEAIDHCREAQHYPHNLGEGKLAGAQENDTLYLLGLALSGRGDADEARAAWQAASQGLDEPTSAMFYNDQPPHTIYYQGLALRALGDENAARGRFHKLLTYGEEHLFDHVRIDYFAVSLPSFLVFDQDLDRANQVHCHYMRGLGLAGLGRTEEARAAFDQALALDVNHYGAWLHRQQLAD